MRVVKSNVKSNELELSDISVANKKRLYKNRNSWYENHEQRKSVLILGYENKIQDKLYMRVKIAERVAASVAIVGMLLYVISSLTSSSVVRSIAIIFCGVAIFVTGTMYYKNVSFRVIKRLLIEPNVIFILVLGILNSVIDVVKPETSFSSLFGLIYLVLILCVVFMDAVKFKSRASVIVLFVLFILLNMWNVYSNTFSTGENGVELTKYTINGKELVLYKRSVKRSIFIQVSLFSISGIYVMMKDKNMELIMFATGNIYRNTGTWEKKDANHGSTIDSIFLLGQEVKLDKNLRNRVKWGQRLGAFCAFIGLTFYIIGNIADEGRIYNLVSAVFMIISLSSVMSLYYKNVSWLVIKRLLKEANVVAILITAVVDTVINFIVPLNAFSPVFGLIYLFVCLVFVFFDALIIKSRGFQFAIAFLIMILNIYNAYDHILGESSLGIKLITYTIQNEKMVIWRRSIKRSIYIQVLLFSINGIWVIIKDKKMELMVFGTGNIYRSSGKEFPHEEEQSGTVERE